MKLPKNVSHKTFAKASKLYKSAEKIDMAPTKALYGNVGDYVYFLFVQDKTDNIAIVYSTSHSYFIEIYNENDSIDYFAVSNILNAMRDLRSKRFYPYIFEE